MSKNENQFVIPYEIDKDVAIELGVKPDELVSLKLGVRKTTGIKVPASKEMYELYMHEVWNEEKAAERRCKCLITSEKTGRIIRCDKKCSECTKDELEKTKSSSVSLEQFMEDNDYEPHELAEQDPTGIILTGLLFDDLMEILEQQDHRLAQVFKELYDLKSTREIAKSLGFSQTYTRELIAKARAILQQHVTREDLL